MSELYLPLRLASQMKDHWDEQKNKVTGDPAIRSFVKSLMGVDQVEEKIPGQVSHTVPIHSEGKKETLNLDDFLSWVIGSTFCKKAYDGKYAKINSILLQIARTNEKHGKSYKESRRDYRNTMAFTTVFRCWEQYKRAYRFDADFVDELMQTDTIEIPTDILKRLPFRCFYLDLEDIPRFDPFRGIFAYIGFDEKTGLPNLAMFRITDSKDTQDGEIPILPCYTFGPDMQKKGMLFINDKGESCLRFTNNRQLLGILTDYEDNTIFDIVLFTLQAMLYLSSNRPDTLESPKKKYVNVGKRKSSQTTASSVDLELTDVGVRYGAAIRKAKKEAKTASKEPEIVCVKEQKSRKPITSHVRSAHWHHYWVGKGRSEQIVKWIPPTFVSGTGKEMPITIQNVGK